MYERAKGKISTRPSSQQLPSPGRPASPTPSLISVYTTASSHVPRTTGHQRVAEKAEEVYAKIEEWVHGELEAASGDFRLLETFNTLSRERYGEMNGAAQNLMVEMAQLQKTYNDLAPHLNQIDDICGQVDTLEAVVQELDEYSRALEVKFKQFTK